MNTALIFAAGVVVGTFLGFIFAALMRANGPDEAMASIAGLTPDEIALADALAAEREPPAAGAMWSDGPPRGP